MLINAQNQQNAEKGAAENAIILKKNSVELCLLMDIYDFDKPVDASSKLLNEELSLCATCLIPQVKM